MRKIIIFSTRGSQKRVHESNVTTWGELKEELANLYDFNSLQATENINRTDLVNDTAKLPEQDFTLFLRPRETKSGTLSYKDARDIVKNSPELKSYIKRVYGKDYTHASTEQLNEAIENADIVVEEETYKLSIIESNPEKELAEAIEKIVRKNYSGINVKVTVELAENEDSDVEKLLKEAEEIFGEL